VGECTAKLPKLLNVQVQKVHIVGAGGVAQVVECLPNKHSKPSTVKKKKKKSAYSKKLFLNS
jgi:pheromone shutdown protein TraB